MIKWRYFYVLIEVSMPILNLLPELSRAEGETEFEEV